MVDAEADRPADIAAAARALLEALSASSDGNLVQGAPGDVLIDGTFDLTNVVMELQAKGYEIHRRV